jgi:large subunit ribosomal protein L25
MPEKAVLKAERRQETGSRHAVKLREQGRLPAIVYGHKKEPTAVSLNRHGFVKELHHGHRLFDVDMGGKKETLLVKDLQYDHLGKDVIHADLVRVDLSEMIKIAVPLELKGTAKGAHESGIIDEHLDHLEIECRVSDIPEHIMVSIKEVGVGDSIRAGDVELPEGARLVTSPEALIVTCHLVAAAKSTEEVEEEMPVSPEVITEKAAEESEGEPEKGK